jgi:hypothetical protein
MKLALTVFSLLCCGCFASPIEKVQKRSIGGDEWLGGYYSSGLSSVAPSISVGAPSIASHTHTHSTAIIDRPYPVAIQTPTITSSSILPSTLSTFNYGLSSYPSSGLSSYPSYKASYPSYPSYSASYPSISYNKYPSYNKYYSRSYPTTIYKKSFISSPLIKSYKW